MRLIIAILTLFLVNCVNAQTNGRYVGKTFDASDSISIAGKWIKGFTDDTSNNQRINFLPTEYAIKNWSLNRLNTTIKNASFNPSTQLMTFTRFNNTIFTVSIPTGGGGGGPYVTKWETWDAVFNVTNNVNVFNNGFLNFHNEEDRLSSYLYSGGLKFYDSTNNTFTSYNNNYIVRDSTGFSSPAVIGLPVKSGRLALLSDITTATNGYVSKWEDWGTDLTVQGNIYNNGDFYNVGNASFSDGRITVDADGNMFGLNWTIFGDIGEGDFQSLMTNEIYNYDDFWHIDNAGNAKLNSLLSSTNGWHLNADGSVDFGNSHLTIDTDGNISGDNFLIQSATGGANFANAKISFDGNGSAYFANSNFAIDENGNIIGLNWYINADGTNNLVSATNMTLQGVTENGNSTDQAVNIQYRIGNFSENTWGIYQQGAATFAQGNVGFIEDGTSYVGYNYASGLISTDAGDTRMGDWNNRGNSTKLEIIDATAIIRTTYSSSNLQAGINLDLSNGYYGIGDYNFENNGTAAFLNDQSKEITLNALNGVKINHSLKLYDTENTAYTALNAHDGYISFNDYSGSTIFSVNHSDIVFGEYPHTAVIHTYPLNGYRQYNLQDKDGTIALLDDIPSVSGYMLKSDSTTIYQTKFRSDTARTNLYNSLAGKQASGNYALADSAVWQTKFRTDSARNNIYSSLSGKQPIGNYALADSTTWQTKFRSDTSRNNIYTSLTTKVPQTRTVAGFPLSADILLASLINGRGIGTLNYNGSNGATAYIDTTQSLDWKNNLYVDGLVGIGTITPTSKLHVSGTLSAITNNDTTKALVLEPTFNNGSYTGVSNINFWSKGTGKNIFGLSSPMTYDGGATYDATNFMRYNVTTSPATFGSNLTVATDYTPSSATGSWLNSQNILNINGSTNVTSAQYGAYDAMSITSTNTANYTTLYGRQTQLNNNSTTGTITNAHAFNPILNNGGSGISTISNGNAIVAAVNNNLANNMGVVYAVQGQFNHNGSGSITTATGLYGVFTTGTSATGSVNTARGIIGQITINTGSNTAINAAYPYTAAIAHSGTGTIALATGLRILAPTGTGPITTNYGLRVFAQARTGVTTAYGIAADGTTDINYLLGNTGLGTIAPTHSLTFSSTSTGFAHYNTSDQTTNYERFRGFWNSNVYTMYPEAGGTGVIRSLQVGGNNNTLYTQDASTGGGAIYTAKVGALANAVGHSFVMLNPSTATSGSNAFVSLTPFYNQSSSTAANTDFKINRTETSVGTGNQLLMDLQVSGVSKFFVNNQGTMASTVTNNNFAGIFTSANTSVDLLKLQSTSSSGYSSIGFYNNSNTQMGGFGYSNSSGGVLGNKVYFYSKSGTNQVFSVDGGTSSILELKSASKTISISATGLPSGNSANDSLLTWSSTDTTVKKITTKQLFASQDSLYEKLIWSQGSTTTVTNSTSELSGIGGTGYGTLTLPANYLRLYRDIRINLRGMYGTQTLTAPTLTIKFYIGGVLIASGVANGLLINATSNTFDATLDIKPMAVGVSGSIYAQGLWRYNGTNNANFSATSLDLGGSSATVNTTIANTITMTYQWSAASTANTVSNKIFTIECLN